MKTSLAALTLSITIASCWTSEAADRTLRASESGPLATNTTPTLPALRLDHSTFLGGTGEDRAHGMAVDGQGNVYLTAPVQSTDFPTTPDALNKTPSGIYFAKLSPAGALLYSTYLGAADGNNYAHGIALDKEGNVYIAGNTSNANFPTTPGAFQTTFKGPRDGHHGDAFILKLSPAENRIIYSTFLGGSGQDICGQIAVDADGNAYVVGSTSSADLPVTPGAFRTAFAGGEDEPTGRGDIFIAKLNPDGSKLVYSTYVGGSGTDIYGGNLVVDGSGSVLFGGTTTSPDFPTTANAFQKSYAGGSGVRAGGDAVLVKLNPSGTSLEYASYVGGRGDDTARSVALDDDGSIWLAGDTTSDDFPIAPAASPRQRKGGADCFFLKLNPRGGPLLHSSVLGGGKSDNYATIAVHPSGLLVLAGRTESTDFPTTPGSKSDTLKGPADVFVALFDPSARSLRYSTLLGGNGNEVLGPLLLVQDRVYLAGNTTSTDFPVTPAAGDTTYNGGSSEWGGDAFVTRFTLLGKNGSLAAPRANVAFVKTGLAPGLSGEMAAQSPEVSFIPSGQHLNALAARGVALDDFNGDGWLDAFVVADNTSESQGHRVFVGDGHGRFADSGQVLAHSSAFAHRPAAGDIDADGDVDVVVSGTVWLNNGRGEFAPHDDRIERAAQEIAVVRLADLDGDGSLDLFAIHGSNTIRIHLNDGKGRFRERGGQSAHGILAGPSSIADVALADVDGNGSIDAVTSGWIDGASDVCPNRVWLNDGHGGFHDSGQILDEADRHAHGVAIGDFDGDNLPDVVLALITQGEAGKIYFNTGQGRFRESGQRLGDQWARGVETGDLDHDGDLDVFLVCGDPKNGSPNQVWLNDGKGRFTDSGLRLGNANSRGAALGDLNGDGHLDAFVANLRLTDASKIPWVFGDAAPEVWLNTTRCAECANADREGGASALVLRSTRVIGGSDADDLGWLRNPRFGADGQLYFSGTTRSPDFPAAPGTGSRSYQGGNDWGTEDVFLARYDPATRAIDSLGLLGGADGPEFVADLQIDPRGDIHIVGNTGSADYPTTTDAAQSKFGGPRFRHADGVLTVIDHPDGTLTYSSLLGGAGKDWLLRLFLEADGSSTLFGITESPDLLPTDRTLRAAGLTAAPALFVARLDARDHRLVTARLLANCWDASVERLESGAFVVAGTTTNPAFVTSDGAFDRSYNGGSAEAGGDLFVLRLSGDLTRVECATLFGGSGDELSPRIAILPNGEILLGGRTTSADLPVTTGEQHGAAKEGNQLFLARFTPDGSRLVFCDTLTDAHPTHRLGAMAHDGERRLVVVGTTGSDALPLTAHAQQSRLGGDSDAFLLVFDTDENAVVQCMPLGGSGSDTADALAFGRDGRLFVLGTTDSEDFPARTAPSRQGQGSDVYVAELATDECVGGRPPDSGAYLGQPPPGAVPEVFAAGIVSTDENEHSAPAFSPDGDEVFWYSNRPPGPANEEWLFFSRTMRREDGRWTAPSVSPFAGMFAFSDDGRRGFFSTLTDQSRQDLWTVAKQGDLWGEPRCLGFLSRFPEMKAVYMASVTRTGTLYLFGQASGPNGASGIYRSELVAGEYTKPQLLPPAINLPGSMNWAPFIAPDESYLLFSSGRNGSLDELGDIYISRRLPDGGWADPVSLGEPVNTPRQEVFPGLSPDGKYLFFCRDTPDRGNDVHWVEAASIPALRSASSASQENSK